MSSAEDLFAPNDASEAQGTGLYSFGNRKGEQEEVDEIQNNLKDYRSDYQNTAYGMQNREGPKTDYSQANADYAQSQQARGNQDWVGQRYRDAMEGKGASVAEKQMNAGRDAAMRDAMQMASGARGGALARSAAQRGAQYQQGAIATQTNQQAAMLRAQEQIAAREGYANLTAQQRAQDMQSRQQSAQQSQFLTESELKQRAMNDQAMLGLTNAAVQTQGQLNASAMGQYDAANQRALAEKGYNFQESQADKDRKNALYGGTLSTIGTVGSLALMSGSDERIKTDITPLDSLSSNAESIGSSATLTPESQSALVGTSTAKPEMPKLIASSKTNAAPEKSLSSSEKLMIAGKIGDIAKNLFGAHPSSNAAHMENTYQPVDTDQALYSDARTKKTIDKTNEVQEFLTKLEPFRFRYKNPEEHGDGIRYGVMAQDMEKSKMGATLVEEDSEGVKMINTEKTFSAILASLSELQKENERLAALIEKKSKSAAKKA